MVDQVTTHWLADPDLASVRHPVFLALLLPDEARAWRAFWAEVRAFRDEVAPAVAPAPREVKR